MKICILATGRCGSTSLFNCIKEHLPNEYLFLMEPFDCYKTSKSGFTIDIDTKNVLLKTLVGQNPYIEDGVMIYNWIFQTFDKVILLDRKNKQEQTESFVYHTENKTVDKHGKKRYYYLNHISDDKIKKWDLNLSIASQLLETLSTSNNSKIYYYEDIFVNKEESIINEIFDYLELEQIKESIDNWIISDNKKVRVMEKRDKFI